MTCLTYCLLITGSLIKCPHSSCCLWKWTTAHVRLPKTSLKISPLHCSFYKLALVLKHEMKKKNLFWHTMVILLINSSSQKSYLSAKSLPLLSPRELSPPAACQFRLFPFAGCYSTPTLFFMRPSPASTLPVMYSSIHWPCLQRLVLIIHSYS